MRRILLGAALALGLAVAAQAQETKSPISIFFETTVKVGDWTVFGADEKAVSLGSPDGVEQFADGTLRAVIRHEYMAPTTIGGFTIRSNRQTWLVDCKGGRLKVTAMELFAKNNLEQSLAKRELPAAEWTPPGAGSLRALAMKRICEAPTAGKRLD